MEDDGRQAAAGDWRQEMIEGRVNEWPKEVVPSSPSKGLCVEGHSRGEKEVFIFWDCFED